MIEGSFNSHSLLTPIMPPSSFNAPAVAFAALLLAACQPATPPAAVERSVLVHRVASQVTGSTTYAGEIRARHEFDLAFRVGGKIAARLVDAGAEIKAGQPLARLDPNDLALAATAAKAQLAAAESDAATAQAEQKRYADLLSRKFISQSAYEAKDNAAKAAAARLRQAQAQSNLSENQSSYGSLSSETPAIVAAVLADAGQVVAAGQAVFRLARPDEKEIAIAVPESRLTEFRRAAGFTVTPWSDAGLAIKGELRELSAVADPATRTYAARIRLKNPPADLRLGMTARVTLDARNEGPLSIPLAAVIDRGQGARVLVVNEGKVQERPVRVAAFREDAALVAEGLQTGELVVAAGALRLTDGQAVTPRFPTPPAAQR